MKILPVLRKIVTLYGICAPREDSDVRFESSLLFLISFSTPEVVHNIEIGYTFSYLYGSGQMVGNISALGSYVSMTLQTKNVRDIFNELQSIIKICNFNENCFVFRENTRMIDGYFICCFHRRKETIIRILLMRQQIKWKFPEIFRNLDKHYVHCFVTDICSGGRHFLLRSRWKCRDDQFIFTTVIEVNEDNYTHSTAFFHSLIIRLRSTNRTPLDASLLSGYCVLLILEMIAAAYVFIVFSTIACLILTWGLFIRAFRPQFESMFLNINGFVHKNANSGSMIELKKYLIEAVEFHNRTKEWVILL